VRSDFGYPITTCFLLECQRISVGVDYRHVPLALSPAGAHDP
jgi:hypothetical protein